MDPIGASQDWRWHGYAQIEGGYRRTADRIGQRRHALGRRPVDQLRGSGALWSVDPQSWKMGHSQIVSAKWLDDAVTPSEHGPDYGYLWWLNTKQKQWPSGPPTSFAAIGNGGNIIWIDPEHDIVLVWHWHQGAPWTEWCRELLRPLLAIKAMRVSFAVCRALPAILIGWPGQAQDRTVELLQKLADAPGPPGFEEPVRKIMVDYIKPYADSIQFDGLGSIIATQGSEGPRIMVDAHMDELGGDDPPHHPARVCSPCRCWAAGWTRRWWISAGSLSARRGRFAR